MPAIIEVKDLSKNYKDTAAVSGVSLEVNLGEIFGLIGPDGAGKSTLLHIIAGVLKPNQGKVSVLGKDVLADPESIKGSIGFLPQGLGLALAQELSVEENIDFFAEINHVDKKRRQEMKGLLLDKTQLAPFKTRPAKNLSGGMKQKLALCCTLIHEPQLIFLDEPTTGVDPISRRDLWTLINGMLKEKQITVFLTTSYMDEASRCHRIALMHKGSIIESNQPDILLSKLKGRLLQLEVNDQAAAVKELRNIPSIKVVYAMADKLNVLCEEAMLESVKGQIQGRKISLKNMELGSPSIEDLFLAHMSKSADQIKQEVFREFFQKEERIDTRKEDKKNDSIMIRTESLEKKFGAFVAVNKISFSVKRGEIFGFLGPNGAGKTTTIKMLCGLLLPTHGTGTIAGLDLFKEQFEIKRSIGYMSQKFSLYRDLTVRENIELYGGIYGVAPKEIKRRRDLILQIADLQGKGDTLTADLPMGIRQRLALGCAIIHKPECVFLDEPTSGVDPAARRKFWDIIFLLSRAMGVTILVTTHYMDEAEYCDRVLLINRGDIVALGNAEELKNQVHRQIGVLLELSTSDPFLAVEILKKHFSHCLIYGVNVHVYTQDAEKDTISIKEALKENRVALKDIRSRTMPFEDVFVYFCERTQKEEGN